MNLLQTTQQNTGETLSPVPIPEQPDLSGIIGLECLNYQDPIDNDQLLQLHVAQLTAVVEHLLDRIKELEKWKMNLA